MMVLVKRSSSAFFFTFYAICILGFACLLEAQNQTQKSTSTDPSEGLFLLISIPTYSTVETQIKCSFHCCFLSEIQ